MVRSPGFGLCACHYYFALLRLAFALAPSPQGLNQRHTAHSLAHSSIGTVSSTLRRTSPLCKRTVSDTISLPSRAAFQRSITVLVRYRSGEVFSLAASSRLLPTGFHESRRTLDHDVVGTSFSPTGLSPCFVRLSSQFG